MKILVLPDTQVKYGQDFSFLTCIGNYIVEKKSDVVVMLGDFCDLESLSSYDVGKKSFEGRRYVNDMNAAREAMNALLSPLKAYNKEQKRQKRKPYKPELIMLHGNHEARITTAINNDPKLDGLISLNDLPFEDWEVIPFLEVKVIGGIAFSHYMCAGLMGKPITSAQALLTKKHMSCVVGHQQGRNIAFGQRADGTQMTAIISGSCYEEDQLYLNSQTNKCWHGLWMLHNVADGSFDECAVPLSYIKEHY